MKNIPDTVQPSSSAPTVLIVDDSTVIRERLADLVSRIPEARLLASAADGLEALRLFRFHAPRVVILDLNLPQLDGFALLEHIKRERPTTCVVMLTTFADEASRQRGRSLGADHFFDKAWEFERVTDVLRDLRDASPDREPPAGPTPRPDAAIHADADHTALEELTRLAAFVCDAPMAFLTNTEPEHHRVIAQVGVALDPIARDHSLCDATLAERTVLAIPDVAGDPRFRGRRTVAGTAGARFYAGTPVRTAAGTLGTLCVMDRRIRQLTASQQSALEQLASQAGTLLGTRRAHGGMPRATLPVVEGAPDGRLLAAAVDQAAEAIVVTDASGNIQYTNPAFEQITGYTSAEVVGRNPRLLKSGRQDRAFYRGLWTTLTEGRLWCGRFTNRRKDGSFYEEEARISPVRDTAGKISHFIALKSDITLRVRAEEALGREHALFESLLSAVPDRLYFKDRTCRFIRVNDAFARDLGLKSRDDAVGLSDADIFTEEHTRQARADDERVILTGQPVLAIEERETWRDGRVTWASTTKVALRDDHGAIIGLVGISRDITGRKYHEERLLRAQRLEAIGSLASGIAHDLNNILTPILLCGPMLRDELPRDERGRIVDALNESAQRAVAVVKQLLGFARGREPGRAPLQIRHLVRDMCSVARETFPRSITIADNCTSDLWPVPADATQLHQVLLNLCVNARDAMPDGGTITLAAENVAYEPATPQPALAGIRASFVRLRVTDTGCGIPEELRARVFEPFFSTKGPDHGTGIGLTTVLKIIKSHGGTVQVASVIGAGTTFEILLPAAPDAGVAPPVEIDEESARHGHGEIILYVDDEPAILGIAREMLTRSGYTAVLAHDGGEAMAHVERLGRGISAVVTDLDMPSMGGVSLCAALRRVLPAVPVIVATGVPPEARTPDVLATLESLGVSRTLTKPHSAEELLRVIDASIHPRLPTP